MTRQRSRPKELAIRSVLRPMTFQKSPTLSVDGWLGLAAKLCEPDWLLSELRRLSDDKVDLLMYALTGSKSNSRRSSAKKSEVDRSSEDLRRSRSDVSLRICGSS